MQSDLRSDCPQLLSRLGRNEKMLCRRCQPVGLGDRCGPRLPCLQNPKPNERLSRRTLVTVTRKIRRQLLLTCHLRLQLEILPFCIRRKNLHG